MKTWPLDTNAPKNVDFNRHLPRLLQLMDITRNERLSIIADALNKGLQSAGDTNRKYEIFKRSK